STTGGTTPGQTPAAAAAEPTSTTIPKDEKASDPAQAVKPDDGRFLALLLRVLLFLALVALQAGAVVGVSWWVAERRRQRRCLAASTPALRVAHAWLTAEEALALVRVTRRSTMTVDEWIDRLKRPAGGAASAGVERGTK